MTRPFMLTRMCSVNACKDLACYVPKLMVPVKGESGLKPLGILTNVELCKAHFRRLKVKSFLTKLARGGAKYHMRQVGAEPDFAGAYLFAVSIVSAEYLQFERELGSNGKSNDGLIMVDQGVQ